MSVCKTCGWSKITRKQTAERIAELEAQVEKLREALTGLVVRLYQDTGPCFCQRAPEDVGTPGEHWGWCVKARAALAATRGGGT